MYFEQYFQYLFKFSIYIFFFLEYDNYENYNEYDNYHSNHDEYDPDMVKKEEPDDESANGSNSRFSSSYYPKQEHGVDDYNENGQTDNYDE